jgi:predicted O-methyltransferase YrrM
MRPVFHFAAAAFGPRAVEAVEVGVEHGLNAAQVLAEWPYSELHLTLVEISPDNFDEVEARLAIYGPYRTHTFKLGDSAKVAATFPDESFDFVYLDDDHDYAGISRSIEAWYPKVKWGGILGGHDYPNEPAVPQAVGELIARSGLYLCVSENDWWVVKARCG